MKIRVLASMTAMVIWTLAVPPARATTMVALSLDQLTQGSSVIVQAQMTGEEARWNEAHTTVITVSTWSVSDTIKGAPALTLQVEQPGGTIGSLNVSVAGVIPFKPGTDYVLFLEPITGSSRLRPVGLLQGSFRVYSEGTTQEKRVILPFTMLQLQNQVIASGNPAGTLPLKSFTKYVTIAKNEGVKIPRGISMPVSIVATESAGVGRVFVYGRTTAQLFPTSTVFIPAGSEVEGDAILSGGNWTIHWTDVKVRGLQAQISGTSQEAEGSLRGRFVLLRVR
jgi:hypothetical protein